MDRRHIRLVRYVLDNRHEPVTCDDLSAWKEVPWTVFTPDACREAFAARDDNSFSLVQSEEGTATFVPSSTRKNLKDNNLTYENLFLARPIFLESAFRALQPVRPGTRLTVQGGFDRPPMERSPGIAGLFARASAVAAALGVELGEGSAGGGSDGNFTAALGVPTLDGLGAIGDGAHAAHEHVDMPSLAWRAALIAGIITSLSA